MSVTASPRKAGPYACDGSDVTFTFAFKVFKAADVRVVHTDALGAETDLTLTTDYSVTLNADQDTSPGGSITTVATYLLGETITLTSKVAEEQPVVITNMGGFYPQVINNALDRLTILVQQVMEQVGRAVKVNISSSTDPDALINDIFTSASTATSAASAASASATTAEGHADDAEAAKLAAEAAAAGVNLPAITGGDSLKLLRVNAAGNAYEFGQTAAEVARLAARTAAITYTVGPTGDYASLNAALADVTKNFPSHASTAVRVTLSLQAAFVMAEQVIVDGLNLGWVTITAGTAVTVTRAALTTQTYSGIYAAVSAKNGGVLPVIDAVFSADTSGTGTGRTGLSLSGASKAIVTMSGGFTNFPKYNLHAVEASDVAAADANFSGPTTAPEYNAYLRDAVTANLGAADLANGTSGSVILFDAAHAELSSADVSGTSGTGVSANRGSKANCYTVTSTGRTTSFSVSAGAIIAANLSGGTLSQTANTITANGIIFQ